MPVFGTLDQIDNYVKSVTLPEIAKIVSIVGKEKLNKQVEDKVYGDIYVGVNDVKDNFYEHTFGLRDSTVAEFTPFGNGVLDDGLLIDLYLDPKSKYFSSPYGVDIGDVTNRIVELLNYGHKGIYNGWSAYYDAKNFMEGAFNDMTKGGELKGRINSYLKRLGYVISRRKTT